MADRRHRKYKEILVIPDAHAKPDEPNDRFEWLGNFIVEKQPDVIVDIGDSADMPSLSRFDVGNIHSEGKRYADDLAAYHDAMEKMFKPIREYNDSMTRNKKAKYYPRLVKTRGNHEHRIIRAATEEPKYWGFVKIEDLKERDYGWECYDYLQPVEIEGICFQHTFTSGVMGRPIGGEHHAANLVKKNFMSSVCGHSHTRDFWETTDAMGRKRFGLVVGCYFEHDEHYTSENSRFWRGLYYLHDVRDGMAEPTPFEIDYIRRKYG